MSEISEGPVISKVEQLKRKKAQEVGDMSVWQVRMRSFGRKARRIVGSGAKRKKIITHQGRDPGKRQRIIFLSLLVVLFVFGTKVWGRDMEWEIPEILLVALLAGVGVYLGLIWALRFDLRASGYLKVLPLPALFVFSSVLFVELFFFQIFERLFETIIFGGLLIGYVVVLNIVFLTTNILNVATVKELPLSRVAQTASYAITVFTVYCIGFSIIVVGPQIFIMLPLLMGLYCVAVYLHLSNLNNMSTINAWTYSFLIGWLCAISLAVLLTWPLDPLLAALMPAALAYIGVGIVMYDPGRDSGWRVILEYIAVISIVVGIILYKATWGIGGAVFQ